MIGLGAIGVLVANRQVFGDERDWLRPLHSVQQALKLSNEVNWVQGIEVLLSQSDYITLNIPLTPETEVPQQDKTQDDEKQRANLEFRTRGLRST